MDQCAVGPDLDGHRLRRVRREGGAALRHLLQILRHGGLVLLRQLDAVLLGEVLNGVVSDPASELYMDPADSSSAYVDHILLPTVDTTTNEPLSEEEIAQNYAKAQDAASSAAVRASIFSL